MKIFTTILLAALLSTVKPAAAQVYTTGDISVFVNESFYHDSTWCHSTLFVQYLATIQNSFLGNVVEMKDETTGAILFSETNQTGANPWVVSIPAINVSQYTPDYNVFNGMAYFYGMPVKIICDVDTIPNILNVFSYPVPDACIYGEITGKVYVDFNNDCIFNGTDIPLQGVSVTSFSWMSSTAVQGITVGGMSASNGDYYIQAQKSWFSSCNVYIPNNYLFIFPLSSCAPAVQTFTSLSQSNVDFPLNCSSNIDIQSQVGGPVNARPMMPFILYPNVSNTGCDTTSGTLTLILDPRVTYNAPLSSNPPNSVNGDTLIWYYTNLSNLSNGAYWNSFTSGVHLTPDITVNIGDTLCFLTYTNVPALDIDATNNNSYVCIPVVNSYDPNMKEAIPAGDGPLGYIPEGTGKLTYKIHFQNTGTAEAYNVSIIDTLESDIITGSLKLLSTSHNCLPEWLAPNIVQFNFINIFLPDSNTNEPMSHGYVQFSVDIDTSLTPGTSIENTAYIYFDFNAPIVTNTVVNTIEIPLGVDITENLDNLVVFPNPSNGKITISTKDNFIDNIQVYNIYGQLVHESHLPMDNQIDLTGLMNGYYLVKLKHKNNEITSTKLLIHSMK